MFLTKWVLLSLDDLSLDETPSSSSTSLGSQLLHILACSSLSLCLLCVSVGNSVEGSNQPFTMIYAVRRMQMALPLLVVPCLLLVCCVVPGLMRENGAITEIYGARKGRQLTELSPLCSQEALICHRRSRPNTAPPPLLKLPVDQQQHLHMLEIFTKSCFDGCIVLHLFWITHPTRHVVRQVQLSSSIHICNSKKNILNTQHKIPD